MNYVNLKKACWFRCVRSFLFQSRCIIAEPLTYILNLSVTKAEIPKIWKVAIVSPVYKSGDKTDPNSNLKKKKKSKFSVLPCVAKVMEKLINKQLIGFRNKNNIASKVQSGFRSSFSCTTAVVKVMHDIYNALETTILCSYFYRPC